MTTARNDHFDDDDEDDFPTPEKIDWSDALRQMMAPYEQADNPGQADSTYTTNELIQAMEQHFGIPQGVVGKEIHVMITGPEMVDAMISLGFRPVNTGGLTLQWLLKKTKA